MLIKSILIGILISISFTADAHKFYVSISDLSYNVAKKRIEGSIKMAAHDFETVLENKFEKKILIENIADTSVIGRYAQHYLSEHFKVYSEGKMAAPHFIGKEVTLSQDLFYYFTFTNISNPKSIKIVNTLFFDLFPKQQNIVHYKYNQQTKSVTLVPTKNNDTIVFE